jgi:signal transduction histidine kinase
MINLIDNAIKYTSEGRISVSIKNTGSTALLRISDTGTGIPPEHINHIFDRFYRADEARRRDTGGAGIGLSIAKTIVIAHNGSISVESEPSKGSTFTVSIPLSKT